MTVMDQAFSSILLLLSLCATSGKYVLIQDKMNRYEAQKNCRLFYTDLAPFSNEHDLGLLWNVLYGNQGHFWMGLERNATDPEKWTWSGGGEVHTFFWDEGQPDNREENYGLIIYNKWHDATFHHIKPVLCYSAVVVRERKTWEEALDYCREHHRDLASVASDTEMSLIRTELGKNQSTEHVWMGLRFLADRWLWVDGQPLEYQDWGPEGTPQCPQFKLRCAALKVMQSRNGTLDTNATVGPGTVHIHNMAFNTAGYNILNLNEVQGSVWQNRDCEERHYFICY